MCVSVRFSVHYNWSQSEINAAFCTHKPDSSNCDVVRAAMDGWGVISVLKIHAKQNVGRELNATFKAIHSGEEAYEK